MKVRKWASYHRADPVWRDIHQTRNFPEAKYDSFWPPFCPLLCGFVFYFMIGGRKREVLLSLLEGEP